MPVQPSEREISRLVRFYEKSIRRLMRELQQNLDMDSFARARLVVLIQKSYDILDELDAFTARWARRNVEKLYMAARREARRDLLKLGLSRQADEVARYAVVDRAAIEALIVDPQTGFVSALRDATDEIRDRLRSIRNQARFLRAHQAAFDEAVARVGILEGQSVNTLRDEIVREIVSLKKSSELVWRGRTAGMGVQSIVSNVANLPYLRMETETGIRHLRVDYYAQTLARTKTKQAIGLARRHTFLQHGQELVRVSLNRPLQDDACWLYLGKVFALTKRAADEYDVPHVDELPSGGVPFHPNCTHSERAFILQFRSEEEKTLGFEQPPKWALNRPWRVVQKEYKRRGGRSIAAKVNRAAAKFSRTTGGRERIRRERGLEPELQE